MLDDTHIIKGTLRKLLNDLRSDQISDSYTIYIHSKDLLYGSNIILKSNKKLRYKYKIHEIIQAESNLNILLDKKDAYIENIVTDYMNNRTLERKKLDFKLLYEELEDNVYNPRTYYYLAQTYFGIKDYKNAFEWFIKRINHTESGFIHEKIDAIFEAARLANFILNLPWEYCKKLYKLAYYHDKSRPDSLYFLGIHYFLENNYKKAYKYLSEAYNLGIPTHTQYAIKPEISTIYIPYFLIRTCFELEHYKLAKNACQYYLNYNINNTIYYNEIVSYYNILIKFDNTIIRPNPPIFINDDEKPIFCFIADGGFNKWSGSSILNIGVGGSETYIIEMARYIQKSNKYNVFVFCNCEKDEIFENVHYCNITNYQKFINTYYIDTCVVSRFSEYLPITYKSYVENVYLVVHDLTTSGNLIIDDYKLKKIYCLTEWHSNYFTNIYKLFEFENKISYFNYGIDIHNFNSNIIHKQKYKFIYSSTANRGLLPLLLMWKYIYNIQPLSSLHIYCDLDNYWVNSVAKEEVNKIKYLLDSFKTNINNYNVFYHGWVDKKTLYNAWLSSDIWFYPCIFKETFCLTALEAAISKTFVITNNLAALENTAHKDRTISIPGDPMNVEWQHNAINEIKKYIDPNNYDALKYKDELVNLNYNWAYNLSWENRANTFLKTINYNNFEYKGNHNWTYNFTNDLNYNIFINIFNFYNNHYKNNSENIKILEIATYTGTSIIKLLKNINNSISYTIDNWKNYDISYNFDILNVEKSFYKNINNHNCNDIINHINDDINDSLLSLIKKTYNLI